ncbi:hypothetical protein T4B_8015 [Trichinella pseudospiralis]|uniref:Uncharacterized protein n=1 Tax=Trichinella pseudospiralis TaxID=6337 RepID=A0A0V1IRB2_TRIPS|nr:hypothetical protein T4B_8015 [Trichinella pseudospiralis]
MKRSCTRKHKLKPSFLQCKELCISTYISQNCIERDNASYRQLCMQQLCNANKKQDNDKCSLFLKKMKTEKNLPRIDFNFLIVSLLAMEKQTSKIATDFQGKKLKKQTLAKILKDL